MKQAILEGAAGMGIVLTEEQAETMEQYFRLVCKANETLNLTRITDPDEAVAKHFLDSLSPLAFGLLAEGATLCDVGAGAGFPGAVLAIARPDLRVTLLDARRKRVDFLREALEALHIPARCLHGRAEDLRERFDVVTARAVAPLPKLVPWCRPLLKRDGAMILYKGKQEAEEAPKGARIFPLNIPGYSSEHVLIVIKK